MSTSARLAGVATTPSPAAWGVAGSYRDAFGRRRRVGASVQHRVLAAMGVEAGQGPPAVDPVLVARPGDALPDPGSVRLDDGGELGTVDRLPPDVPIGYHRLESADGPRLLIVAPRRCFLPDAPRAWGWACQLYATRSRASWGIGDLADLRRLTAWSARLGAGYVALNPIGAANPGATPEASPYFPSTRRFRNPLHLRIEEVPGADGLDPGLLARGRALNEAPLIDRAAVQAAKLAALDAIWARADRDAPELRAFRSRQGASLGRWGTFAALSERLGPGWRSWPEAYRTPDAIAVRRFAADHADRVAFHEWVQWQLDLQLEAAAGSGARLLNDLPVGADPGGFDAWEWQELLARDASTGAPPDRFNALGQDWSLPPFVPHRLRAAGYRPFVEIVRSGMRHAGGLRIDHVLGLFRLWWVPRGHGPARGAYVRYRADELLAILAIESHRARALVVGEDLGTVPRGVRSRLARSNVLSTRLLYFERRASSDWPRLALAAVTTHDLPTIAGCWTGVDLDDQAAAGLEPDAAGLAYLRARLASTVPGPEVDERQAIVAAHAAVARAPSLLALATLEDALAVRARPNIPGTTSPQRANWSMPLPAPLEEIEADPFVARVAAAMRR